MPKPLPAELASEAALLAHLGVGAGELAFLMTYAGHRYSPVSIPKRSGGVRLLIVPDDRLKYLQRKILPLLEALFVRLSPVHGFTAGQSAITNAREHQSRRYLLNADLKDYFPSITRRRVRGVLSAIGCPDDVANAICAFCVVANQLPQGAPTSPILSNMVAFKLDLDLLAFSAKHKLRYTRFADDLSFSSHRPPVGLFETAVPDTGAVSAEQLSRELRSVISRNGFTLNEGKLWFSGRDGRKEVTGLVVNELINVRRSFVRNIRAGLYKAETLGIVAAQADLHRRLGRTPSLENYLRGRIEWLAQVRGRSFSAYRTLSQRYNNLFPLKPIPIDPTEDEIVEKSVWVVEYQVGEELRQGTAFFLGGVGLVTCEHVVRDLPNGEFAEVFRPGSKKYVISAVKSADKRRDLAVLQHNIPSSEHYQFEPAAAPDRNSSGITALGFPDWSERDELSYTPGHLIRTLVWDGVRHVQVSAVLDSGISGGPIVNERLQVVAIAKKGGLEERRQVGIDVQELFDMLP